MAWNEPHEFGYFWERHFPFAGHHEPEPWELSRVDASRWTGELSHLEKVLDKPLVLKNLLINFVLGYVAEQLSTAKFVCVRRPLLPVAQSILRMRRRTFGKDDAWWSIRPSDAATRLEQSPADQIAYQIDRVLGALVEARERMGTERWMDMDYEAVCNAPAGSVESIVDFLGMDRSCLSLDGLPSSFSASLAVAEDPDGLAEALKRRGLEA
jgi:hypothetical protein